MQTAQFTAAVAIAGLSLSPAYAAGQGKSAASPKAHGPSTHTQAPRTTATHGAPKPPTTTHGNPHTTTTKTSSPTTTTKAHGNPHTATSTSTSGATTPVSTAGAATTTSTTTLNPIAAKLKGKPLGSRIEQMLAPTGMTLNTASDGFRNQGQFIAAVHVSQNLGVPFADLKATMLGTPLPGAASAVTSPMSLGQAIQQLKPFSNATTEAARAETQAATDLHTISASTTNTTTTKKSKTRGR